MVGSFDLYNLSWWPYGNRTIHSQKIVVILLSYICFFNNVHYCTLCYEIVSVDKSPLTKFHKSRFAALAETINSWEDEVISPSAKSVTD